VRIIAGSARGTAIHAPPGSRVRPTSDRVREALFSILGGRVPAAWVLDAYAGVGSVGLEALSRGAAGCDFIEADRGVLRYLRKNIAKTGLAERARVFGQSVERFVAGWRGADEPYDVVFADPPYGGDPVGAADLLRPLVGGLLVLETADVPPAPRFDDYDLTDRRTYGKTALFFLEPR
jgi:16S rRNA (guanine966-N2)-methyltransferase